METTTNLESENKVLILLKELLDYCEKSNINYCMFINTKKGEMLGASKLSLEEVAIIIENLIQPLSIKETDFILHLLTLLKQEKKERVLE